MGYHVPHSERVLEKATPFVATAIITVARRAPTAESSLTSTFAVELVVALNGDFGKENEDALLRSSTERPTHRLSDRSLPETDDDFRVAVVQLSHYRLCSYGLGQ